MIVVAGWLRVEPARRSDYLADCLAVVAHARRAQGCHDFAISADVADDSRINVFELWEDESSLLAFRQSGPDGDQQNAIVEASVRRYEVSSEGPP